MKNIFRNLILFIAIIISLNFTYSPQVNKAGTAANDKELIYVEGGSFTMGQTDANLIKKEMARGDLPTHNVNVNSFYIGKYEVTQKQWRDIMDDSPSRFKDCDKCPVESVSWWGAIKYCNYRSIKEGLKPCYIYIGVTNPDNWPTEKYDNKQITCDMKANGYRLPTEAEWEFAARGGNDSKGYKYSGSNDLDEVAWYRGNSDKKTHQVGEKKPNELGIYDMSGNVREWCWDWYDDLYYSKSPKNNPMGQDTGKLRVLRGGSWVDFKYTLAISQRENNPPESREGFGFRIVRSE